MGKASKWIRNFLVGKKEEKNKKKDFPKDVISVEIIANSPSSILTKEKRRWSFRKRATSRTDFVLRSMKSFDSIVNSEKLTKALVKYSGNEQVRAAKAILPAKQGLLEHGAATKIQAAFRSYLARRALCALRALVKLQALVRGYLVRKRTTATLRCMHSLISIQVRARVQRIWLSDDSQSFSKDRTGPRDLVQLKETYSGTKQTIIGEKQVNFKIKRISGNSKEIKRIDTSLLHFSPRVPISEQELHIHTPSSLSNVSTRQNSPRAKRTKQNVPAHFCGPLLEYEPWMPNYMANTESSRAKARSHSEPKQRPQKNVKQKSQRSTSNEGLDFKLDDLANSSSANMSTNGPNNQNPWLAKLYQSAKGVAREKEYDNTSGTTDSSSNTRLTMAFEPPVNLY